jgi:putative membrane protein
MSESQVAAVKKHKSLARGLIAGLIAGLAATAAKSLAERIFPPLPKPEPESPTPPAECVSAEAPSSVAKEKQNEALRWGLGAVTGAAYGAVAEFYPDATSRHGVNFGLALEAFAHPGELPVQHARVVGCWPFLKLKCTRAQPEPGLAAEPPKPEDQPQIARQRGSQITSYVVYGVTAELVRRLVRRWL